MTSITEEANRLTPDGYTQPSDYSVGFRQIPLKFGKSQLPINIWYPTRDVPSTTWFGPYAMCVSIDATPVKGRGRLIVISHGSKGNHLGHRDTAMHLAAQGFTVVSPLHPHDNYLDDTNSGTPDLWRDRPFHIKQALDAVLSEPVLGAHLCPTNIGIIGFSLGGYTALALLGAKASVSALVEHRNRYPEDMLPVAPDAAAISLDDLKTLTAADNVDFSDAFDKRITGAVLLAPMCALFSDTAFSRVSAPIALYCAEQDKVLREPYHSSRLSQLLPTLLNFTIVAGAGHFSFLCPFPGQLQKELPELALDDNFDRPAFHERLNLEISEFFAHAPSIK